MSRVKTALIMFYSVLFISLIPKAGLSDNTPAIAFKDLAEYCEKHYPDDPAKQDTCINNKLSQMAPQGNNPTLQRCTEAEKSYRDDLKDVQKICGENLAGSPKECLKKAAVCDTYLSSTDLKANVSREGYVLLQPDQMGNIKENCPAYLADLSKGWKDIAKNGQSTLDNLQKEDNDAKKQQQDIMKRMQDNSVAMEDKIKQLTNQEQELVKKVPTMINDINSQMQSQIQQFQQQFQQDQIQLQQYQAAQDASTVKYNDDIGQIDAKCRQAAIAEFRDIIKLQTNNAGGFIGLRDSTQNGINLQNRMINWDCSQPSVYEAKQAAARARNLALASNQRMIEVLKQRINQEPTILNNLYQSMNNKQKQLVVDSQSKLQQLASEKSTLMQKLSSQTASDAQSLQLAQQRAMQVEEKLHKAQSDLAIANSNLNEAGANGVATSDKVSAGNIRGLTGRYDQLKNNYCAARLACVDRSNVASPVDRTSLPQGTPDFIDTSVDSEFTAAKCDNYTSDMTAVLPIDTKAGSTARTPANSGSRNKNGDGSGGKKSGYVSKSEGI